MVKGNIRTAIAVMITVLLIMASFSAAFADEETCSITMSQSFSSIELIKGGTDQIDLDEIITDSSGHELTYSLECEEDSLKARLSGGAVLFAPLEEGEYWIAVTASCAESGASERFVIPVNVTEAEDDSNPAQYGYDETPAESVTVTVTIASDGIPLRGNDTDNTVIAHLSVTVPYFDLGLYGLERFYRYHTKDGRGKYIDEDVVERPTAMHLMIYMTERYYMGIPEEQCCKGNSGILDYSVPGVMYNMYGNKAYDAQYKAYEITGSATSTYMRFLWGHDENLMYYRNHVFPLMSPGWGSTSDYQLLSDGNTFDLCMFTNWDFHYSGAFCCFDKEEYETKTGQAAGFAAQYASSSWNQSGSFSPIQGLILEVYDDEWNKIGTCESETSGFEYTFNESGTYYIIGRDVNGGTNEANKAPATAVVKVKDAFTEYPFERIADDDGNVMSDIQVFEDFDYFTIYHVKVPTGTESVNIFWKDLEETELVQTSWDFKTMEIHDEENAFTRDGDRITVDPSKWELGEKALLLSDEDYNYHAAFTFEFYTPEHVNFAPQLKAGISPVENKSIREQKDFKLKMSDVFTDPDGDEMTYTVSIDGGDAVAAESSYSYDSGEPGSHILVFTPTDSKGMEGQTYTVKLKVTKNVLPGYLDANDTEREITIRYFETAKLNLFDVLSDFDDDHIIYQVSREGGEYEDFDPDVIREWDWNYNGTGQTVWWDARNLTYEPSGAEDIGDHVFLIKGKDDLGCGTDTYTLTVHVVENQAPVPQQEEITAYCMLNHYWYLPVQNFFTDPEGDKIQSYTVSVNGSTPVSCERHDHNGMFNCHRVLIENDEPYTVQFFATDNNGAVGTCTARVYPTEEIIHEVEVNNNVFSAGKDDDTLKVTDNVTVRGARYSEYDGDYNYYIDIDDYGVTADDKFRLTMRDTKNPIENFGGYHTYGLDLNCVDQVKNTAGYRIIVNMIESGDPEPEELYLEPKKDELYVGELADRCVVKARFSDGVTRYISDYALSDTKFDTAGKHTLSATALGLTATAEINVKSVPDYIAVINDIGKYGRLSIAEVVDENNEPVSDASIKVSEPVTDPDYDDEQYDGSYWGGIPDMLRDTYDVQVRVPMAYQEDQVRVRFRLYSDIDHSVEYLLDNGNHDSGKYSYADYADLGNVKNEEQIEYTDSYVLVDLTEGQGSHVAWWIDRSWGMRSWWHSYDLMDVHVKTGACEIIGKVSSWDEKDNAEFLAYPEDMSNEDIRADAMGEREHALSTSATVAKAEKNDGRYEQGFKVEGLDAGKYKLAVIKPGKYTVSVVEAEIDGAADIGTILLRLYGDINNDGKVRAGDATQVCRYIAGNRSLTDEELLAADVNLDGKVRAGDATQICRYIASNNSAFDNLD